MNFSAADQLAREHQADLVRLAQAERAARLARRASRSASRSPVPPGRWRLAVARGLSSAGEALARPRPALGPTVLRRCKLEG